MRSKLISIFSMLGVLLLTSCATTAPDGEVDWQHGAKRGWIVKIYPPKSVPADSAECLSALSAADVATRHFVKIDYRHVRQMFSTIAELPPDAPKPRLDEQVEFWPGNCSDGKVAHITRVFP